MKVASAAFCVQQGEVVDLAKRPTTEAPLCKSEERFAARLSKHVAHLSALQKLLYASNQQAVLLIFQAMDAAGKDGAIEHVMSGVNPQDCQVFILVEVAGHQATLTVVGDAVSSCRTPVRNVADKSVVTIEGLAQNGTSKLKRFGDYPTNLTPEAMPTRTNLPQ